ncbi:hypothetical protein CI610_02408 [invertebrate metagenome]|uniref:Uncharacterized protein n=1 Tax=invertebrate metagenome TaxID=1711999 RepID=A0A2H9T624_9ZZZZ
MEIFSVAILLFLIMDPLGNLPVFIAVLKGVPEERRTKILFREMLIALIILLVFVFAGENILQVLHLKQESVGIAGGIILFMIAIKMIFPTASGAAGDVLDEEPFIVPLATPLVAGPSILAALILSAHQYPGEEWKLVTAVVSAWAVTALILMFSNPVMKLIGHRGVIALERLMGMVLVMLSIQMLLDALKVFMV